MVNTTTVGGDSDEFPIEDTDDESPIEKIDRMERLCRRIHPIIPKSSKGLFTFFDAILYEAERLHGKDAVITSLRFSALDCRYPSKSILQEYDTRKRYWNNGQRWNASNDSDYVGLVIFHSLLADEWFQDSRDEFEKMFEFVIPKVLS